MIIDAQLLYSDAQAVTADAGSTNVVDHGQDRNLGLGEPLAAVITVDVAADGTTGDETYVVLLETDDNAAFSSATEVARVTIPRGSAAGTKFVIPVPPTTSIERFTRLYYDVGGTTPTITVTAFLQPVSMIGAGENVYYADAITIG